MPSYRVNASFELIGGFWLPTEPDTTFTGRAIARKGKIEFLPQHIFTSLTSTEQLSQTLRSLNNNEIKQIKAICGETSDGACTLLQLYEMTGDSVTNLAKFFAIEADRYGAQSAVMGLHLDSPEAPISKSGAFYFSSIHRFLPAPWEGQFTNDSKTFVCPSKPSRVFDFYCKGLNATVLLEIFLLESLERNKQIVIQSVPRIRVISETAQSVEWYQRLALRLENFFTLLLGTSVALRSVQLLKDDDSSGWIVQAMKRRKEKVNPILWPAATFDKTKDALDKWLSIPQERQTVELVLLNMLRKSSLYLETEFLSLAQALEGFSRFGFSGEIIPAEAFQQGCRRVNELLKEMWGKSEIAEKCKAVLRFANEPSFARRIRQASELISPTLLEAIIGTQDRFIRRAVETRNYLTHIGIPKTGDVLEGIDLHFMNLRLHTLLRCLMLLDLGFTEDEVRRAILQECRRWR